MAKIVDVNALKVLNALGNWTVAVKVTLADGRLGVASVPSGVSVGRYEAKTVSAEQAVANIDHLIRNNVLGLEAQEQVDLDRLLLKLDPSVHKSYLGANTLLAVSEAVCSAAAASLNLPLYRYLDKLFEPETVNFALPTPLFNMIEGGQHTHNDLDFQEFLFIPKDKQPFLKKVELGVAFYHELKEHLLEKGLAVAVGDEGGFSPGGINNFQALELLREVFPRLNLAAGEEAGLGLDAAAGSFNDDGVYQLKFPSRKIDSRELIALYASLSKEFPLVYLEDPLFEDDPHWEDLPGKLGGGVEVIGDDLTATNEARLRGILPRKIIQGVVIKPNQVGTITETMATVAAAKKAGLSLIVAHRAGETASSFIADLAVGIGAKYIKFGAPARGERVAKYDRLLEIEAEVL